MTPKLLVLELWGVGDLAMASVFLKAACEHYQVTLLAKPFASDFKPRFWPQVEVVPCVAPWTAFRGKYQFHRWPWKELCRVVKTLRKHRFDLVVSARWDPRDHMVMAAARARRRIGFARLGSGWFLTESLPQIPVNSHRYEYWCQIARTLSLELPAKLELTFPANPSACGALVHSGAAQAVRVWPLERWREIVLRLRGAGFFVQVACDRGQREWWISKGMGDVKSPATVAELIELVSQARAFVGNDSGAGHVAATAGVPTFTIFGNNLPERFAPLHPASEWIEGKVCPYKPCFDSCRFPAPNCLWDISLEEAWLRIDRFVRKHAQPS